MEGSTTVKNPKTAKTLIPATSAHATPTGTKKNITPKSTDAQGEAMGAIAAETSDSAQALGVRPEFFCVILALLVDRRAVPLQRTRAR